MCQRCQTQVDAAKYHAISCHGFISQFVAYFNYSNIGTIAAIHLVNLLKEANLGSVALLLGFILIGFLPCFLVPAILPKWAIMAPIFVPLLMKLGIDPDIVLAACRVSDSPPNVFVITSIALGTLMGAALYKLLTERFGAWQLQLGRVGGYFRRGSQR